MPLKRCVPVLKSPKGRTGAPELQRCECFCKGASAPKVMESNAGWYIGTTSDEDGYPEAQCRMTDYFPTRQAAEEYLKEVKEGTTK